MKYLALLILYIFQVTNVFGQDPDGNDSFEDAWLVNINTVQNGLLNGDVSNGPLDVIDYYKFTLPFDGAFGGVPVPEWPNSTSDISYQYFNSAEEPVTTFCKGAGNYYLVVTLESSQLVQYNFTIGVGQTSGPNDSEPNNFFSEASLLEPGILAQGHIGHQSVFGVYDEYDVYKVENEENSELTFDFNSLSGAGTILRFKIFEKNATDFGNPIYSSTTIYPNQPFQLKECLAPDTFFVVVDRQFLCGSYNLMYQTNSPVYNNDVEVSGGFSNQDIPIINLSQQFEGQLGHQSISGSVSDYQDIYKLVAPDTTNYKITGIFEGFFGSMSVYTATPTFQLFQKEPPGANQIQTGAIEMNLSCLPKDTVFLSILSPSTSETCGSYQLTFSLDLASEICDNGIDDNCNGLVDEDCQSCDTQSFASTPTGLFEDQSVANSSKTQLKWDHYSDASDGCIIRGALSDGTTNIDSFGQILVQGAQVAGDSNGNDKSGQLAPNASYTLFNVNTYPSGITNSLVPGAQYMWQVRCGCIIDPTLPFPQRLYIGNLHLSPWSSFSYFTNLGL